MNSVYTEQEPTVPTEKGRMKEVDPDRPNRFTSTNQKVTYWPSVSKSQRGDVSECVLIEPGKFVAHKRKGPREKLSK